MKPPAKPAFKAHATMWAVHAMRTNRPQTKLFATQIEAQAWTDYVNRQANQIVAWIDPPLRAWAGKESA